MKTASARNIEKDKTQSCLFKLLIDREYGKNITMKYPRVYTDSSGASHFDDVETELSDASFALPAPPLRLSPYYPASRFVFCGAPAGWFGDWHPAPKRQIIFYLRGNVEIEVSDGEIRHFGPGDIVLLEDTTGVGHIGRIGEAEEMLSAVVQLSD